MQDRLPGVDAEFRDLDSRMRLRLEQHGLLEKRLQSMLVGARPDFLATGDERLTAARLAELEASLEGSSSANADDLRRRIARLQGVITYTQTDHWGFAKDNGVVLKVTGGDWKVEP